jgi:hypothetical protein
MNTNLDIHVGPMTEAPRDRAEVLAWYERSRQRRGLNPKELEALEPVRTDAQAIPVGKKQ